LSRLDLARFVRSVGALAVLSSLGGCDDCPGGYFPPEYVITVKDAVTGDEICDAAIEMELEETDELVLVNDGRKSCGFRTEAVNAVANQSPTTDIRVSREGYETTNDATTSCRSR
jgi:hypothetical protein